jgi:hypothetical protein
MDLKHSSDKMVYPLFLFILFVCFPLGSRPLRLEEIPGTETLSNYGILANEQLAMATHDAQKSFKTVLQKLRDDKNSWPFRLFLSPGHSVKGKIFLKRTR